jgi:hypothetical protein
MENFIPFHLLFGRYPDLCAIQQNRDDGCFADPYLCRSLYCSAVPDPLELMKGSICFLKSHIEVHVNCSVPTDGCTQMDEVVDLGSPSTFSSIELLLLKGRWDAHLLTAMH